MSACSFLRSVTPTNSRRRLTTARSLPRVPIAGSRGHQRVGPGQGARGRHPPHAGYGFGSSVRCCDSLSALARPTHVRSHVPHTSARTPYTRPRARPTLVRSHAPHTPARSPPTHCCFSPHSQHRVIGSCGAWTEASRWYWERHGIGQRQGRTWQWRRRWGWRGHRRGGKSQEVCNGRRRDQVRSCAPSSSPSPSTRGGRPTPPTTPSSPRGTRGCPAPTPASRCVLRTI